jgi:ABC-type lipoprotein export system ATPase subunit
MIVPGASIIDLRAVSRRAELALGEAAEEVRDVTLAFAPQTFSVISGESGSGARLLLRLIGLLEKPDAGDIVIEGSSVRTLSDAGQAEFRARRFGFLFTAPFLLPAFTAIENIAMPIFKLSGASAEEAGERAERLLAFVGMTERAETDAGELSPYEQYCVAIARALANQPRILLVDQLDSMLVGESMQRINALLRQTCDRLGATVVATVSPGFPRAHADRVLEISAGRIQSDSAQARSTPV